MAAALFLHNAIFAADPPSPPAATAAILGAGAHRAPNRRGPHAHDRHLSSVSSITLQTSTSDHSHPTESLIHPDHLGSSESSVYLDLLARQPTHPGSTTHLPDRTSGLSLQGDAVSPRERKERHEKEVRRRLRRLRLVQRVLWVIIGEWHRPLSVFAAVSFSLHLQEFFPPLHATFALPSALRARCFDGARSKHHLAARCSSSPLVHVNSGRDPWAAMASAPSCVSSYLPGEGFSALYSSERGRSCATDMEQCH